MANDSDPDQMRYVASAEPAATSDAAERRRRRRVLALTLVLMLGLPLYLIAAATVVGALTAPMPGADGDVVKPIHWTIEFLIYVVLGLIWAFPLKGLVKGLGKKPS